MKQLLFASSLALVALALSPVVPGHGGTYRGPGDTVPPGGGGGGLGSGPGLPGPSGPGSGPAGPARPSSPRPASPLAGSPPAGGSGGFPSTDGGASGPDLTQWQFWWGFNKEPYLELKARIHAGSVHTASDDFYLGHGAREDARDSLRPSRESVRATVVPALLAALERETATDIVTGALVALAKIGDVEDESGASVFEEAIARFLASGRQEVAETAAIALGILARESSVPMLAGLLEDTPEGRRLVGSTEVPYRTRAFAAYGLGIIGKTTNAADVRRTIALHLVGVLESPALSTRDVKVAAMIALGLTPVLPLAAPAPGSVDVGTGHERHVVSRAAQVRYLIQYFDEANARANANHHWFVRAHAPTAMARLVQDAPALAADVAEVLLRHVDRFSRSENEIQQSCILALGRIADCDDDELDVRIRHALAELTETRDQQSRRFALIALAQAGGRPGRGAVPLSGLAEARRVLLSCLARGSTPVRPWAALALGVLGSALQDAGLSGDPGVSRALADAARQCKGPDDIGAYALALGMRRDLGASPILVQKLEEFRQDDARAACAVGLGLMNDRSAIAAIQEVIASSRYHPELLREAAVALGLLGDKDLVPVLVGMLGEAKGYAVQAAIATALGAIGDARSLPPLVDMLADDRLTDGARGFAAVALGIVCDPRPAPWNSVISTGLNYRANTITLTSVSTGDGILDIL